LQGVRLLVVGLPDTGWPPNRPKLLLSSGPRLLQMIPAELFQSRINACEGILLVSDTGVGWTALPGCFACFRFSGRELIGNLRALPAQLLRLVPYQHLRFPFNAVTLQLELVLPSKGSSARRLKAALDVLDLGRFIELNSGHGEARRRCDAKKGNYHVFATHPGD
jgi:hypothetical protein